MDSAVTDWAVISLGNHFRGDDSVGPYLLHRLREKLGDSVDCIENGGDMTRLLEDWTRRRVCLVDAIMAHGRQAGDIIRLNGLAEAMPASVCTTSSHGLNLAEAIELGRVMGALPLQLDIYGICGENFTTSAALSPAVEAAAAKVEQEILKSLMTQTGGPPCTSNP
ncbi:MULTISPECIES: hydrogenase maturation protease [unclassified Microbulbifer]|uniref:hydrogenase maturation protease n=1 Tax=unclassified Microbulbifer TaxID=2619833 RepID=UPI0027E4B7F8|nr:MULTISPECIES: hydrogenase maturation protease [unclassified Microbulbifer]